MGFGQTAGPPASAQQLAQLVDLLREAGYDGFREARHPFGLSQRQAGGKFTRDEAAALIDRLAGAEEIAPEPVTRAPRAPRAPRAQRPAALLPDRPPADVLPPDTVAAAFPDELLADELIRRGWTCTPPPGP